jgi:hypothetical protein
VPGRIEHVIVTAFACLAPGLALAQTPEWPTPQDIDRALKAHPFPARIESARSRSRNRRM